MAERPPFRHPATNPQASSSSSRTRPDDSADNDDGHTPNVNINTIIRAHPQLQPTGSSIEHPMFGFSNPGMGPSAQANLPMGIAARLPRLPPIHSIGAPAPAPLPGTASTAAGTVDLSEISRATLYIPEDTVGFRMSEGLRNDILNFESIGAHTLDSLVQRLCSEAELYANDRKELVRNEMKRIENEVGTSLTTHDRTKLRSRREAKVSRTKQHEYERALLSALKWLIRERNSTNQEQGQGQHAFPAEEIYNQIQSQSQVQLTPAPTTSAPTPTSTSGQPSSQRLGQRHQQQQPGSDNDGDNVNRRIWD